jgi:hypothetical protein
VFVDSYCISNCSDSFEIKVIDIRRGVFVSKKYRSGHNLTNYVLMSIPGMTFHEPTGYQSTSPVGSTEPAGSTVIKSHFLMQLERAPGHPAGMSDAPERAAGRINMPGEVSTAVLYHVPFTAYARARGCRSSPRTAAAEEKTNSGFHLS